MTTILLNDLSTFMGTIGVGDTKDLVLVGEVSEQEANAIWSVALALGEESLTDPVASDVSADATDSAVANAD